MKPQLMLLLLLLMTVVAEGIELPEQQQQRQEEESSLLDQQADYVGTVGVLEYVGNNGDFASSYPLEVCRGDCDGDNDCLGDLICFVRNQPNTKVPGCLGGETDHTTNDYCAPPPPPPYRGQEPLVKEPEPIRREEEPKPQPIQIITSSMMNLPTSPVVSSNITTTTTTANETTTSNTTSTPSSTNNETTTSSSSSSSSVSLSITISRPAPTNTPPIILLDQCQGMCQEDSDCAADLMCYKQGNVGEEIPYCYFSQGDNDDNLLLQQETSQQSFTSTSLNVCTLPPNTNPPTTRSTEPTTLQPTILPTLQPTLQPTIQPSRKPYQYSNDLVPAVFVGQSLGNGNLGHCQGDCDANRDCVEDLICWQRNKQEDGAPGCSVLPEDTAATNKQQNLEAVVKEDTDLCVDQRDTNMPTMSPTFGNLPTPGPPPPSKMVMFVGNPADRPLLHCEADCDSDNDCDGDLICVEREGDDDDDDEIPGCYFDPDAGGMDPKDEDDICLDTNYLMGGSNSNNLVRLRLYWEEGYYWQEDRDAQYWCLRQRGDGVDLYDCDTGDEQQIFEMIFLHTGEALIRSITRDQCLEGKDSKDSQAHLEDCDLNESKQKFIPQRGGWGDKHFELTRIAPKVYGKLCLTNHHHPRSGEAVEMRDCDQEREYTTSAWQFWW